MSNHKSGMWIRHTILATTRCWSYDKQFRRIRLPNSNVKKVLLHQTKQKFTQQNLCRRYVRSPDSNILWNRLCAWYEHNFYFPDEDIRFNPTDLHAPNYHIMGVDLRNVDEVANKLKQAEVDFTVPTIFIAECVLVYIEPQNCTNLLKWFSSQFQTAVFVIYEQVNAMYYPSLNDLMKFDT